jgi:hypothetical protein
MIPCPVPEVQIHDEIGDLIVQGGTQLPEPFIDFHQAAGKLIACHLNKLGGNTHMFDHPLHRLNFTKKMNRKLKLEDASSEGGCPLHWGIKPIPTDVISDLKRSRLCHWS